ncbi:MAG: DUF2029 domain-containing protein, partial [Deltaproteobacteria bacterium]|nr:DUF2029 domain-containing protein [Deltaproteobacteria bacterium]
MDRRIGSGAPPARERRLVMTIWIGMVIAVLFVALTDRARSSMLLRGDFPGFYAPAVILANGQNDRLYDLELQREVENRYWPRDEGQFFISAYPPFVARVLQPLSLLTPDTAKFTATALLFLCYVSAIVVAGWSDLTLRTRRSPELLYCLLLAPVAVGVLAAQNTAVSLLLICVALDQLRRPGVRHELVAGAALALWLFKPQFGLPSLFLVGICARRWGVLIGAIPIVAMYWLIGASVLGPNWLAEWVSAARSFGDANFGVNGHQMVSCIGGFHALAPFLDVSVENARTVGGGVALCLFGAYALRLWVSRDRVTEHLVLLGPVVAICTPQTLFYDLGFCLPAFLSALPQDARSRRIVFGVTSVLCGLALAA